MSGGRPGRLRHWWRPERAWPLLVAYLYRGLPLRSASRPDRGHILASPDSAGRKGPDDEDLTHLCRNRPGGCFTHHQHERRRAALGRPARRLERSRLSWRSWPRLGPWLGAPRLSRVSRRLVRAAPSAIPASLARRLWLVRAAVLDRMALWVPGAYLPVTRRPAGGAGTAGLVITDRCRRWRSGQGRKPAMFGQVGLIVAKLLVKAALPRKNARPVRPDDM